MTTTTEAVIATIGLDIQILVIIGLILCTLSILDFVRRFLRPGDKRYL